MNEIINWIISGYPTIAFFAFLFFLFSEEEELFASIIFAIFWPFTLSVKAYRYLKNGDKE